MVSLVNSTTRIGWQLWEIDLRFAPGLPPGWSHSQTRQSRVSSAASPSHASTGLAACSHMCVTILSFFQGGEVPEDAAALIASHLTPLLDVDATLGGAAASPPIIHAGRSIFSFHFFPDVPGRRRVCY